MINYLISLLSLKKISHKGVSLFSYWDNRSHFTRCSQLRYFTKLKVSRIGKYTRINPFCELSHVNVGNFTAIGHHCKIGLGQHPLNYVSTHSIFYKKNIFKNNWVKPIEFPVRPINIGNDVWIGIESTIMDGVTIGDGAVIGAKSLVTKDVPPFAVVGGIPAKIIKYRFAPEIINKLLEIKWWDLSDKEIEAKMEFFHEPLITIEIINKYFNS